MTNNIELESGNGRFFQNWVLKTFKQYKLPKVFIKEGEDACSIGTKNEIRKYQDFVSYYISKSNQQSVLLYHGLGSGKTRSAINVYNVLHQFHTDWNIFLMIKSSLHEEWVNELKKWLVDQNMNNNIHFIHYDSPTADKNFMEVKKKVDAGKKTIYYIDEVHNFIKNVYSNMSASKGGRAQVIYDYIMKEKKTDSTIKVIAISATPLVNNPFELALLFNLLRPDSFPSREADFSQLYLVGNSVNSKMINMFQRRIIGLVSYYIGATADLYASKKVIYVNLQMSPYHTKIYQNYENMEAEAEKKKLKFRGKSTNESYMTYTRQACNFVFPEIDDVINGINRPRPGKFRISEKEAENIDKGKEDNILSVDVQKYKEMLLLFMLKLKEHFSSISNDLEADVSAFKKYYKSEEDTFEVFMSLHTKRGALFEEMYKLSPKFLCACFYIVACKGSTMFYSNYVRLEGLEIFKLYLSYFGFSSIADEQKTKYKYCEFHGSIDKVQREKHKTMFNGADNKYGEIVKLILISPSGTEGLNLKNVLQVHLLEPYWNEVRMEQMIGRAIRQCSHKDLPLEERRVLVFRYKVLKDDKTAEALKTGVNTTDNTIEVIARTKNNLNQQFLTLLKQVAVDCQLFKNHNMALTSQEYKCFQFSENSLMNTNPGPAYKHAIKDDLRLSNGLNSDASLSKSIKVRKIKAVTKTKDGYSDVFDCWLYDKNNMVYDYELYFPIGKLLMENEIAVKLDRDTFILGTDINNYY